MSSCANKGLLQETYDANKFSSILGFEEDLVASDCSVIMLDILLDLL
jgi:hypothetical protein